MIFPKPDLPHLPEPAPNKARSSRKQMTNQREENHGARSPPRLGRLAFPFNLPIAENELNFPKSTRGELVS